MTWNLIFKSLSVLYIGVGEDKLTSCFPLFVTCFFSPRRLIKMEWSLHAEWPFTSSFHFPAAAVRYWVCVGGFAFLQGSGSQKSGGGQAVWDCQVRVIKRPQESLIERRKHGGKKRLRGQRIWETEVGGRRTMSLLMRTFLGAYVGHCMDKNTFTTLRWRFTQGAEFFIVYALKFPFYTQAFTQHSFRNTWTHGDRAALSHSTGLWMLPHCNLFLNYLAYTHVQNLAMILL